MKNLNIILLLLLSACVNLNGTKEKPLRHEAELAGDYVTLTRCVANQLRADSRWFMRILHYKSRIYPDIETAEIYAYDTRFMPGIYPSNSPTNPDAVQDYINPNPEILSNVSEPALPEAAYKFVLTTKKMNENVTHVTVKGDEYLGDITWSFLRVCADLE